MKTPFKNHAIHLLLVLNIVQAGMHYAQYRGIIGWSTTGHTVAGFVDELTVAEMDASRMANARYSAVDSPRKQKTTK